jgi:sulfatase modifying factor 1
MRVSGTSLVVICLLVALDTPGRGEDAPPRVETALVKGARFTMGTPIKDKSDPKYHRDEAPLKVSVKDFRIGKYPVTAGQMCAFLNSPEAKKHDRRTLYHHEDLGPYAYSTIRLTDDGRFVPRKGAARAPANQVTWKGAVLFCEWLSRKSDKKYRLPSEAEWEYAARGKGLRTWPWGDKPPTKKHGPRFDPGAWLNSRDLAERIRKEEPTWPTTPVGTHPANATPEGVHDMMAYLIGEWCANKYVARPTAEELTDARADLTDLKSERVVRGPLGRKHSRPPPLPLMEWPSHGGRTWTRAHAHPITAPRQAAWYGFRVVEELDGTRE